MNLNSRREWIDKLKAVNLQKQRHAEAHQLQPTSLCWTKPLVEQVLESTNTSGDGPMTKSVQSWFQSELHMRVLPTTSCSSALDMAAILSDIGPGIPSLYRVTRLCLQQMPSSCAEQRPFLRIQRRTVLTWDLKKSSCPQAWSQSRRRRALRRCVVRPA